MPVATVREMLSPLLRQRLAASIPEGERAVALGKLDFLLRSIQNVPPVTHTPPPVDPANPWPLAQVYQRAVLPEDGTPRGPLTLDDEHTLQQLHYLCEVYFAPKLENANVPGIWRPQSVIHARLLNEVRRAFGELPFPPPRGEWETSARLVASDLLVRAMHSDVQPTEVEIISFQEIPAVPGRHLGGVKVHLVAWSAAIGLPWHTDATASPNVWDPSNPLGNEGNLRRAPVQLEWMDLRSLQPE